MINNKIIKKNPYLIIEKKIFGTNKRINTHKTF